MVRSPLRSLPRLALLIVLLTAVLACEPKTAEEKVAEARAAYVVELNSWFPRTPEPEPMPEMVDGEEGAEGESADGEMAEEPAEDTDADGADGAEADGEGVEGEEGELGMIEDTGPQLVDVFFDLIVLFEGSDPLPGLTLEISQADAGGGEKQTWRHYLELPSHIKGETKQVSFELPDIEFAEGDQFSIAVRKNVPAAERGDYREFASAGQ